LVLLLIPIIDFVYGATSYNSNVIMNATVTFAISVTPSTALGGGIEFGSLSTNTNNNLALNDTTGDYALNVTLNMNSTDYNLTVDSTSTFNVDFFNKAKYGYLNNSENETILIQNVTLEANQSYDGNNVNYTKGYEPNTIRLTASWAGIGSNSTTDKLPCNNTVNTGSGYCAMIYFLDVPANQPSGNYNTTYCFCAVEVGAGSGACSC